jgi:two-component system sensor histidine kinase MtrB
VNNPLARSLQARVMVTVCVVSAAALTGIGLLLTSQVRAGVFNARLTDVLQDAASAHARAQDNFDASSVGSPITAETLARDTISSVFASGSASVAVSLEPPAGAGPGAISRIFTDPDMRDVASAQLRAAAEVPGKQVWQAVSLPSATGGGAPGIAVAQSVSLLSTSYVLVLVYDLSPEQATMNLIVEVLAAAAVAVFALVVFVTWLATHQAVRPVREAAKVAAQLAAGELGERIPVRGRDEMATLAASFNEMAASMQNHIEQLQALSKVQRRFVSDVSHELRTPLSTIRMAGAVIYDARDAFPPEVARSAELLATQLDRFDALLADLLEISRFDAGAVGLETELVDVRDVVGGELDAVTPLAQDRGVRLRRELPAEPVEAAVDTRRVARIVRNLVVNGIEHSGGSSVTVTLTSTDAWVAVAVEDNGLGLDPDAAARVFDRFWRADQARSRTTGGTGLGLAIALEDAKVHGGAIDVAGRPGQGAVFRLLVPKSDDVPSPPRPEARSAEVAP